MVKNPPDNAGDPDLIPGQEDPLEKRMATHSSILTGKIPWTERSLVGYSPWGHKRVKHDLENSNNCALCIGMPKIQKLYFSVGNAVSKQYSPVLLLGMRNGTISV